MTLSTPAQMAEEALKRVEGGPLAWAHRLKVRYLNGDSLTPAQIALASEALREVWEQGQCRKR